ncbi:MAG: Mur ligase domain-containing protein [Leptospiraceae bacterium]|nr:Mur ligase domain-containing protein [Leptospiraceae bacterium]
MKIFLIGIGGIAMGNLAKMLSDLGHEVSGSDENLYPPMSEELQKWGLPTFTGFDPKHLKDKDLVIVGNAISRGNPQVEEMLAKGMDYMSMPQAISHFLLKGKKVIVIAGTHGKTTTTFLVHHILKEAGFSPGLFVGGIRQDGHAGFEIGKGEYFVIEGDEYDSAFFDKASKFLHYRPYYAGLTALDFDHADIFPNLEAIQVMFQRLLRLIPNVGKVFYYKYSKALEEICKNFPYTRVEPFTLGDKDSILAFEKNQLILQETKTPIQTKLIGKHNFRNIELALRITKEILGNKFSKAISSLKSFPGVKRRQEVLYQSETSILIEDFAHHPVAIQETIQAVKLAYPNYKILSLFEPRSATSHRNVFQKEFSYAFKGSEAAFITEVYNVNKVPKKERLNVKRLVKEIPTNSKTKHSFYAATPQDLPHMLESYLNKNALKKVILLAMSNGAFGGIYPNLIELLRRRDHELS